MGLGDEILVYAPPPQGGSCAAALLACNVALLACNVVLKAMGL